MPNRILKESLLTSLTLDGVTDGAETLFTRLVVVADDYGRFRAEPAVLLAKCYPLKVGRWKPERIELRRNELVQVGAIALYTDKRKALLGHFPAWLEHQRERTSKPKYDSPEDEGSTRIELRQLAAIRRELPQDAARARRHARPASESRESRDGSRETRVGVVPPPIAATRTPEGAGSTAWVAYSRAYFERYGADPVRNAKANACMAELVRRIGAEDAPYVAEFYVSHPSGFYETRGHSPSFLVGDCEKLRTEWATKRTITATQARRNEQTAANPFMAIAAAEAAKEAGE